MPEDRGGIHINFGFCIKEVVRGCLTMLPLPVQVKDLKVQFSILIGRMDMT